MRDELNGRRLRIQFTVQTVRRGRTLHRVCHPSAPLYVASEGPVQRFHRRVSIFVPVNKLRAFLFTHLLLSAPPIRTLDIRRRL